MKKILILLICFVVPINVFANNLEIDSKSAIVVNRENDETLFEKEKELVLPIASLTKIMTVLVTLENITSLDDKVIVTNSDISNLYGYQVIGLTNGLEVSYKDLIYSTLIYSAGDSAKTLSNNVFNDYNEFINKMNEKAKEIGMNNTKFSNPVGFDNNNYSTSYDLYLLLDYALDNEIFYEIYTTKKYYMSSLDKTITGYVNEVIKKENMDNNGIIFDGNKTGYTNKSGLSLSGITKLDNNEILIITIGAEGDLESRKHIKDSINILKYIKENYSNRVILEKNKLIDNIIYKDGKHEINYEIRSPKTIKNFMNNTLDSNYLKVFYEGKTIIDTSIKKGDELGKINIYYEEKLLDSIDVVFDKKFIVKENKNYKNLLIFVGICLLGLVVFKKKK